MKGIVVAAGLGSRMGELTRERPKCMLPLAGRALLERTASNLRAAGCDEVVVVVGYQADRIALPGIVKVENPDFASNNILQSLMCAKEHLYGGALVSYSDIWVEPWIHERLLESTDDISIAVDRDWTSIYPGRLENPISEAEKVFFSTNGAAVRIGKHLSPGNAGTLGCGEFLGLWLLTEVGARRFVEVFEELDAKLSADEPFQHAKAWRNAYITDLFQELVDREDRVGCTLIERGWAELDTAEDYHRLESIADQQRLWTLYPGSSSSQSNDRTRALGARVLSVANDLKRTAAALADDIGLPVDQVRSVIHAEVDEPVAHELMAKIADHYPISAQELDVPRDDTDAGARTLSAAASRASARVFDRPDRNGAQTPYYEYRDTAMSRMAPFKPEWIRDLRTVSNSDPENPDVIYNNGHLLHQTTFFIGEVNFYWETRGRRHCAEMQTGDSNYITPFVPHSFASRNPQRPGLIIAVTYAAEVSRALSEFGRIGGGCAAELAGNLRVPQSVFVRKLARQLAAESLSPTELADRLVALGWERARAVYVIEHGGADPAEIEVLAGLLQIRPMDLAAGETDPGDEVILARRGEPPTRNYPPTSEPAYRITELARCRQQPGLKGFELEVIGSRGGRLRHGLSEYVYNYGDEPVELVWSGQRRCTLEPGDSAVLLPWVEHAFVRLGDSPPARLCVIRVPGRLTDSALDEFAAFSPQGRTRAGHETLRWF